MDGGDGMGKSLLLVSQDLSEWLVVSLGKEQH